MKWPLSPKLCRKKWITLGLFFVATVYVYLHYNILSLTLNRKKQKNEINGKTENIEDFVMMKDRDLLYGVDNKSNSYILQSVMNNKMMITDRKVTDKKRDMEYVYRGHRDNDNHKSLKQFAGNKIQTKKKQKIDRNNFYRDYYVSGKKDDSKQSNRAFKGGNPRHNKANFLNSKGQDSYDNKLGINDDKSKQSSLFPAGRPEIRWKTDDMEKTDNKLGKKGDNERIYSISDNVVEMIDQSTRGDLRGFDVNNNQKPNSGNQRLINVLETDNNLSNLLKSDKSKPLYKRQRINPIDKNNVFVDTQRAIVDENNKDNVNKMNILFKQWDKRPPFITHSLDELEVLYFYNISSDTLLKQYLLYLKVKNISKNNEIVAGKPKYNYNIGILTQHEMNNDDEFPQQKDEKTNSFINANQDLNTGVVIRERNNLGSELDGYWDSVHTDRDGGVNNEKLHLYSSDKRNGDTNNVILNNNESKDKDRNNEVIDHKSLQMFIEVREEMRVKASFRRRFPQCIIIGVNKAGTLALLEFLSLHPQVVRAPAVISPLDRQSMNTNSDKQFTSQPLRNEMNFFNKLGNYEKGYEYYLSQMPITTPDQVTIEKSPGYFRSSVTPRRIQHFYTGVDVRLIVIVRNPIDRAVSDYLQRKVTYNSEQGDRPPYPGFEEMVTSLTESGERVLNTTCKILQNSIYHHRMKRWMSLFPRPNIHVVNGDTFTRNPVPELTQIESFLQLPRYFIQSHFYLNSTKGFYCYYNNNKQEQCLKKDKGMRHPEISQGLHRQLQLFFEPHNAQFYQLVGQDFGWNS